MKKAGWASALVAVTLLAVAVVAEGTAAGENPADWISIKCRPGY